MELGIFCNYVYPSIGGSELVCKSIAEYMSKYENVHVSVYGFNVKKDYTYNNVLYKQCQRKEAFLKQLKQLDHIFIYSDSFWEFDTILFNLNKIKATISLVLLGMDKMLLNKKIYDIFYANRDRFTIIVHSKNYKDYKFCIENNIQVQVIPNGVQLSEFCTHSNFREKFNIKTKFILLNISNFFIGKGQEYLVDVGNQLLKMRNNDFTIVQCSNEVKYPYDNILFQKMKKLFSSTDIQYKLIRNADRVDIISALLSSDIMVFTSLKEVFPLVILEAMASKTPWISMNVGNVSEMKGGISIDCNKIDSKGYKIINKDIISKYAYHTNEYLNNYENIIKDGENGRHYIETQYDCDKIYPLYKDIFMQVF